MDLLTPLVTEDKLHQHFKVISGDRPSNGYARKVLEAWLEGFPDRDGKFIQEFQTTFNSSFWEIYLHAALRELGAEFYWKHYAPDFILSVEQTEFVLEATTANAAQGSVPEWSKSLVPPAREEIDLNEINRVAIIRLANAFMNKATHYIDKYSKLEHVKGKPFLLAIAPFEQPWFNLQVYRPIEALLYDYYVDEQEYLANPERFPGGLESKSLGSVTKDNGSEIELGFFNCERFSHVSAVVFSNVATWGKVDALSGNPMMVVSTQWETDQGISHRTASFGKVGETIIDGLRIYHNPYAKHPLPANIFKRPGVVQTWTDPDKMEMMTEGRENSLTLRSAFVINTVDSLEGGDKARSG
jgi:hypothetical protein